MRFFLSCLQPDAVLMLFVATACLIGYGYPSYQARNGYFWLLWLFIGVIAAISWLMIVAS